jgi:glycosyltransferase involved in cell wall biosynthesis
MDRPENQNNFPSKTLEYLASGRYTISTKFAGWERFENNFEFYDNSIEELAAILKNAELYPDEKLKSYYEKNRKKAKEFDWNTQVRRILKMVE